MKRDPDLIRKILFFIEENAGVNSAIFSQDIQIEEFTNEVIIYHLLLLKDAGYIESEDMSTMSGIDLFVKRLTWEGHEFIEAARNDTNWKKVKEKMAQTGGFVLELAKPLLIELAKSNLGLN